MDPTIQPHHRPSSSSASKLPVKRKTPDPQSDSVPLPPPPLKFHRIWTEPDEIRFLQGLLDSSSINLSFPRDLGIFYSRFSNTMSQPYTKSQLSEKLRRLRKKFRVISTRLSKGLDRSQLSMHDRALFDLSKQLWHPDYAATSPFNGARNVGGFSVNRCSSVGGGGEKLGNNSGNLGLVGIKVDFSPTIPAISSSGFEFDYQENVGFDVDDDGDDDVRLELDCLNDEGEGIEGGVVIGDGFGERNDDHEVVKLSEVNVELEEGNIVMEDDARCAKSEDVKSRRVMEDKIGEVAAKAVMGVFEESLEDVRRRIEGHGRLRIGVESFNVRWQRQRVAEFDVLGKRLRLLLENSLGNQ